VQLDVSVVRCSSDRRGGGLADGRGGGEGSMTNRGALLDNRFLRPFSHLFAHPSLWHLNRRSVPRGLAIGLFVGFLIPLGQFVLAALLAVPLRANVGLSAGATLVTNPITFPFIYFAAFTSGRSLLGPGAPSEDAAAGYLASFLEVSVPTALGLLVFAIASSAAGYVLGALCWRVRLVRQWKRRASQRTLSGRII
jgi:uncharacterized protein (DUF2062 family)